jgi:hypothetical protein
VPSLSIVLFPTGGSYIKSCFKGRYKRVPFQSLHGHLQQAIPKNCIAKSLGTGECWTITNRCAGTRSRRRERNCASDQTSRVSKERVSPRTSLIVENLNSRLRNYFFLRWKIGPTYLSLRFFLNHRRFLRSERPKRMDKIIPRSSSRATPTLTGDA